MRLLCSCLFALSLPALASTQLTLPDGREVVLEDDFTWHYLLVITSYSIHYTKLYEPGAKGFLKKYIPFLKQFDTPVIVNIWGKAMEDYGRVVELLDDEPAVSANEINLSCPNVKEGGSAFGTTLDMFSRTVELVRGKTQKPIIPKLAPNVPNIGSFAKAAEECGSDAVSIMNRNNFV